MSCVANGRFYFGCPVRKSIVPYEASFLKLSTMFRISGEPMIEELFKAGDVERAWELAQLNLDSLDGDNLFYAASAGLVLGNLLEASPLVEKGIEFRDPEIQSRFICLKAFLARARGMADEFKELCDQAIKLHRNAYTLFYFSQSTDFGNGLAHLKEALSLAELKKDVFLQGTVCNGLATVYRKLGKHKIALSYAVLASLKRPEFATQISLLEIRLLVGDHEGIEEELRRHVRQSKLSGTFKEIAEEALAEYLIMKGRVDEAIEVYKRLLKTSPAETVCFAARGLARSYLLKGNATEARKVAELGIVSARFSQFHEGIWACSVGVSRFPEPDCLPYLERALPLLRKSSPINALEAEFHLAAYYTVSGRSFDSKAILADSVVDLQELCQESIKLHAGKAWPLLFEKLGSTNEIVVNCFGNLTVTIGGKEIRLRPKGRAILLALVLNPFGLSSRELSRLVYFESSSRSLKVEISRLRATAPGLIVSKPYRLGQYVKCDYLDQKKGVMRGENSLDFSKWMSLFRDVDFPFADEERQEILELFENATHAIL